MIIVYCADRSIYHLLPTTLNSLLQNNKVDKVYLLIEDDNIEFINHPSIEFINCNQFDFLIRSGLNVTTRFPYMAMTRCFLTKILKEDKVIYLDVDTIIDGSLEELWNIDISSTCVAGRREEWKEGYINSGVLLMNLRRIRQLKLDESLSSYLKSCKFIFPDQDAMNLVFKGSIKYLCHKFNALGNNEWDKEDCCIRHFAGVVKPWKPNAHPKDTAIWDKYKTDRLDYQDEVK